MLPDTLSNQATGRPSCVLPLTFHLKSANSCSSVARRCSMFPFVSTTQSPVNSASPNRMEVYPAFSEITTKITVRFRSQIHVIRKTCILHDDAVTLAGVFAKELMERRICL
jgi:hypothetical protein